MLSSIKVLSFDLDDTLWPCLPTIQHAEKVLYQWLSEQVPTVTRHYDQHQLRDKRKALMQANGNLMHDLSQLRLLSFKQLAEEFELGDEWIEPAFDIFYEARQKVTLFDDVQPVLDRLIKDFQLVSLTNGNADIIKTGVDHWFDFSLNSISVGKKKSEPDIYRQVLSMAKIDAQQMVHVGDDPFQDVRGAKLAGIFSVWLNREQKPWEMDDYQPDVIISSLHELPGLINR